MKRTRTLQPKKRGPKPTGIGVPVQVRLQPDLLASLDAFLADEPGHLTRPEAIRKLIDDGLERLGYRRTEENGDGPGVRLKKARKK